MPRKKSLNRSNKNLNKRHAPPPAKVEQPSFLGGLMGTMAQGFAFGGGSAVAHKTVDALTGSGSGNNSNVQQPQPLIKEQENTNLDCKPLFNTFSECLKLEFNSENCENLRKELELCLGKTSIPARYV